MLKDKIENKRIISDKDLPKAEKLVRELHEKYPEVKPRLTFPFPISQNRKTAIELIKKDRIDVKEGIKLINSMDGVEIWAGLDILSKADKFSKAQQTEILKILLHKPEQMKFIFTLSDWDQQVVKILGNFDQDGIKYLKSLEVTPSASVLVFDAILRINARYVEKNPEQYFSKLILEEDNDDINWSRLRIAAINNIHLLKDKAFPILSKVILINNSEVKKAAINSLGLMGEKAIPLLANIIQNQKNNIDKANLKWLTVNALINIGRKASPILEQILLDTKQIMKEITLLGDNNILDIHNLIIQTLYKWSNNKADFLKSIEPSNFLSFNNREYYFLLSQQKSLFSNGELEHISKRMIELQNISLKFKEKYPEDFVGFQVFGSTSKGYMESYSDLDIGIISNKYEIFKEFRWMNNNLKLCQRQVLDLRSSSFAEKDDAGLFSASHLFYGLFFGDFKKLLQIQDETLSKINFMDWNSIRAWIISTEGNISKAQERFAMTDKEYQKIKTLVLLAKIPPPLEEVKKMVKSRINLANKKDN